MPSLSKKQRQLVQALLVAANAAAVVLSQQSVLSPGVVHGFQLASLVLGVAMKAFGEEDVIPPGAQS